MQKIQEILQNLSSFQIPVIPQEQQLSEQEKANFFYFLTAAELSNMKVRELQKESFEEVILKKVKIFQSNAETPYLSFKFTQESPPVQDMPAVHSLMQFNNITELKQYLKQMPTAGSEINKMDQQIVQSLNIMIQQENSNNQEIIQILLQILYKETSQPLRYEFYLNKFCLLIKQRVVNWINSQEYIQLSLKFIQGIPKYDVPVMELLKEFCEQCLNKQNTSFDIYFNLFKNILKNNCGLAQFVSINHKNILDHVKTLNYSDNKDILNQEAINKIMNIQSIQDQENALNYIFYMGCHQVQVSKHAKVLAILMNNCPQTLVDNIQQKLAKIRDNEKTRPIFLILSQSIVDWTTQPISIIEMFVEFFLENKKLNNNYIYAWYFQLFIQKQSNNETLFKSIIDNLFEQMNTLAIISILERVPLELLVNSTLGKLPLFDLKSYLYKDENRILSKFLFKRMLKENDQFLKQNGFELLKLFLDLIKEYENTREILEFLFQSTTPTGLIAAVMMNCVNQTKATMQEEMRRILADKPQYLMNDQILKGIKQYKEIYPQIFDQIVQQLDENSRQRLISKKIL